MFFGSDPGWTIRRFFYAPVCTAAAVGGERREFSVTDGFAGIVVLDFWNRIVPSAHIRSNGATSKFPWWNTGPSERRSSAAVVRGR